jgi:hypothetical protein
VVRGIDRLDEQTPALERGYVLWTEQHAGTVERRQRHRQIDVRIQVTRYVDATFAFAVLPARTFGTFGASSRAFDCNLAVTPPIIK